MHHYIYIINNIELGGKVWLADEIMKSLLNNNIWAFSISAPNLKYMDEGDRIVVYLAGKGNRSFAADFTIASKPYEAKLKLNQPEWLAMFPLRIDIKDRNLWKVRVPISEVINILDFIHDKKNYGLYFRQSAKVVEKNDFLKILATSGGKHIHD